MTADTTFKEFVEEKDLTFSLLVFDSPEYRNLVEEFNNIKFTLEAEKAREYEKHWARLIPNEQPAMEGLCCPA